jgi:hypothetical protein
MSGVDKVRTATVVLVDDVLEIQEGARTIDLVNSGLADATFMGQTGLGNLPVAPVTLAVGQAYSFGDVNKPYNVITVDASGTTVEISVNY